LIEDDRPAVRGDEREGQIAIVGAGNREIDVDAGDELIVVPREGDGRFGIAATLGNGQTLRRDISCTNRSNGILGQPVVDVLDLGGDLGLDQVTVGPGEVGDAAGGAI